MTELTDLELLQEISIKLDKLQEVSTKLDSLANLQQVNCFLNGILCGVILGLIFWLVMKE
jgi:formate/nitrite transporter FocA (FNT family)